MDAERRKLRDRIEAGDADALAAANEAAAERRRQAQWQRH
jgi:hypothetical protein